jgi:hypothetical protein
MLEINLANDPAFAVRASERMAARKLLDAEHTASSAGKVMDRRAAHGAESDYDDVEEVGQVVDSSLL